jgi:hypothetical protein
MRFAALLLLLTTTLFAQSDLRSPLDPVPEYLVHRCIQSVAIDGDLSDSAWEKAPVATLSLLWPEGGRWHQGTRIRMLWDEKFLYAAFDCDDAAITARDEQRGGADLPDDFVVIFLSPSPARARYVGLEINANAVLSTYLYVPPDNVDRNYHLKDVRMATKRRGVAAERRKRLMTKRLGEHAPALDSPRGWTIEVAIPLANFALEKNASVHPGTIWATNLTRWDATIGHSSVWVDSGHESSNPRTPQRFGRLRFGP